MKRKNAEDDLGWLLQKEIIHVVDKLVESYEFLMGVKRMKMACMAAGVENGKHEIREQVMAAGVDNMLIVATTSIFRRCTLL